ncbi:MAG TPA: hypothetical protein ENJ95_03065 [Bacteroidetes bacterium]|nr:hypothetical protein [Bacteroidota bacterium]
MKYTALLFLFSFSICPIFSQNISSKKLLQKSIAYHDPSNQWPTFNGELNLKETRPNGSDRHTQLQINNNNGFFKMEQDRDGNHLTHILENGECSYMLNNSKTIAEEDIKKHKLNCKRTQFMRNYYVYLYGLPMKLNDPGTIVHDNIEKTKFQDQDCFAMKVTYEEGVGNDIWYFYFHPKTYAMIGYRFYHDEEKNDGEYITLEGVKTINNMRLPMTRKWYVNKDGKFLGADILE